MAKKPTKASVYIEGVSSEPPTPPTVRETAAAITAIFESGHKNHMEQATIQKAKDFLGKAHSHTINNTIQNSSFSGGF